MRMGIAPVFAIAATLVASAAPSAEPIQLKFADPIPPTGFLHTQVFVPWTEEVNAAAAGVIEVKLFPGPAIANLGNVYDRTINGVADIAWGNFAPVTTQFPRTNVATLPFEARTGAEASLGMWRLFESGVITPEFHQVKVLALTTFPGIYLRTRKPILTMADLKGMKITAEGRVTTQSLENLGATPVHMSVGELYQSLSRGTVDGAAIAWPAVPVFKLFEVTSHHLEVALGNDSGYVIMNKESYARLPQRGRDVIDRFSGEALTRRLMTVIDSAIATARGRTEAMPGQVIAKLAPDEEARWAARVAPAIEGWTRSTPDGAAVLAAFREEVRKIRAGQR
jgi:TRAP-type C4-dicarboxylate transport system substrate-binding protein